MIFGRHSVLKRGCSTWDPAQVPQAEFQARLDAVRQEMARRDLDALVIYGDNYSFADLCYLTNYFPKVRGGIAVVPRDGAISLLLNIGSRDVPFAKTLTWVEDVRASNQVGGDGAKLIKEKGFEKAQDRFGRFRPRVSAAAAGRYEKRAARGRVGRIAIRLCRAAAL